jgi:hypothetical protein
MLTAVMVCCAACVMVCVMIDAPARGCRRLAQAHDKREEAVHVQSIALLRDHLKKCMLIEGVSGRAAAARRRLALRGDNP